MGAHGVARDAAGGVGGTEDDGGRTHTMNWWNIVGLVCDFLGAVGLGIDASRGWNFYLALISGGFLLQLVGQFKR